MNPANIKSELKSIADPLAVKGMARFGIKTKKVYGVSIPHLKKMAKEIGTDRDLASKLWKEEIRETRILARMIDDPNLVTEKQMEQWVCDFDNWEICDQCIMNLFQKTPFAWKKAVEWSSRKKAFVKRASFVLIARLAVSEKKADDARFNPFFILIEREAHDNRIPVKKAINWALRQIGKRSRIMNIHAIESARRICAMDSKSARWIASDALRELESDAVQKRFGQ